MAGGVLYTRTEFDDVATCTAGYFDGFDEIRSEPSSTAPVRLVVTYDPFDFLDDLDLSDELGSVGATVTLSGGPLVLIMGAGDDSVRGVSDSGSETLDGGSGNDTLDGLYGDDVFLGGAGDDTLIGGYENDRFYGGVGNDLLDGGHSANWKAAPGTTPTSTETPPGAGGSSSGPAAALTKSDRTGTTGLSPGSKTSCS